MKHAVTIKALVVCCASVLLLTLLCADVHGAYIPEVKMIFHARWWTTIPGWEPMEGDYAYIEFTPEGDLERDVQSIMRSDLRLARPESRALLSNAMKPMEPILDRLVNKENFKIGEFGFDFEFRPETPAAEQQDPVGACRFGQALARRYNLPYVVAPTAAVSMRWGREFLPYVDILMSQAKGLQVMGAEVAVQHQRELFGRLHAINPKLRFRHDTALYPKQKDIPLEQTLDYYLGLSDMTEAIGIWATPPHRPKMGPYVLTLRPPKNPPAGDRPPEITRAASVSKVSARLGEEISFSATATDPDGDALTYIWDFDDHKDWGDGNVLVRGQNAKHAYRQAGEYSPRVTVTDGRGGVVRSVAKVNVAKE